MVYCPLPDTYAVVQIDVQATVKDLDDEAKGAAKDVEPAFCIVYLHTACELPMPSRPWFRYLVYLVGPGLRHAEPDNFITPEMCVPIYPETEHPTGRAPLQTSKPFPFTNCYHWADAEVNLRVARGDYSNEGDAIELPGSEHFRMEDLLTEDLQRIVDEQDAGNAKPEEELDAGNAKLEEEPDLENRSHSPQVTTAASRSASPVSERGSYSVDSTDSISAFPRVDIFGFMNARKNEDLLPVVNLWYNLAQHVDQDNIPDPIEFLKQRDALVRIVKESNARKECDLQNDECKDAASYDTETVESFDSARS